jgi:hypothetical protein
MEYLLFAVLYTVVLIGGPIAGFFGAEWVCNLAQGRLRARREIRQAIEELV